jgi:hypothetical protein
MIQLESFRDYRPKRYSNLILRLKIRGISPVVIISEHISLKPF